MPEALILEFNGVSEADYEAVSKQPGIDMHTGLTAAPAGRRVPLLAYHRPDA